MALKEKEIQLISQRSRGRIGRRKCLWRPASANCWTVWPQGSLSPLGQIPCSVIWKIRCPSSPAPALAFGDSNIKWRMTKIFLSWVCTAYRQTDICLLKGSYKCSTAYCSPKSGTARVSIDSKVDKLWCMHTIDRIKPWERANYCSCTTWMILTNRTQTSKRYCMNLPL